MHARRVLADAGEHRAVRRIDQPPHQQPAEEERDQAIDESRLAEDVELEEPEDRIGLHAGEAVGAAGEPGRLVRDFEQDRGDGKREHQQRQRFGSENHGAGRDAEQRGHHRRGDQLQERIGDAVFRAEDAGGIGAEAEERAVAERDDAGVAEDQIERQREEDVDQDSRAKR